MTIVYAYLGQLCCLPRVVSPTMMMTLFSHTTLSNTNTMTHTGSDSIELTAEVAITMFTYFLADHVDQV